VIEYDARSLRTLLSFLLAHMYILLAISILCFFALVLAAVAIAGHVRSRQIPTGPQPDFSQHLFAAVKNQNSRTPRTLPQRDVRAIANLNHAFGPTPANIRNQSISSKRF
jgi:hypothetical protein